MMKDIRISRNKTGSGTCSRSFLLLILRRSGDRRGRAIALRVAVAPLRPTCAAPLSQLSRARRCGSASSRGSAYCAKMHFTAGTLPPSAKAFGGHPVGLPGVDARAFKVVLGIAFSRTRREKSACGAAGRRSSSPCAIAGSAGAGRSSASPSRRALPPLGRSLRCAGFGRASGVALCSGLSRRGRRLSPAVFQCGSRVGLLLVVCAGLVALPLARGRGGKAMPAPVPSPGLFPCGGFPPPP